GTLGTTLTVDSSGKTGGACVFNSQQGVFQNVVFTGRNPTTHLDTAFFWQPNFNGTISFTNWAGQAGTVGVEIDGGRIRGSTYAGSTVARIQGSDMITTAPASTVALTGTATVSMVGINNLAATSVAAGCTLTVSGSNVDPSVVGVFSGGGAID